MKIRLRDNSLRLRLSQAEVAAVHTDGYVSSQTSFGEGALLATRLRSCDGPACRATFDGQSIEVSVPASVLGRWADSTQVTIEAEQTLDDGQVLRILVEKDFACLTERPGEDDSDAFPHPRADSDECSGH